MKFKKLLNDLSQTVKESEHKIYKNQKEALKIFEQMKKQRSYYMKTLLKGEEDGHCTGIKLRIDI